MIIITWTNMLMDVFIICFNGTFKERLKNHIKCSNDDEELCKADNSLSLFGVVFGQLFPPNNQHGDN